MINKLVYCLIVVCKVRHYLQLFKMPNCAKPYQIVPNGFLGGLRVKKAYPRPLPEGKGE